MQSTAAAVTVDEKQTYAAKVRQNYPTNKIIGITHGVIHYIALGFYYQTTVMSAFIMALTNSAYMVGIANSLGALAHQLPQLFATSLVEHLEKKKKVMLLLGFGARVPWLIMGMAVVWLGKPATFAISLTLYLLASAFYGMYLLVWTDVMSKVIPLEFRGNYFGLRNFLASIATSLAGLAAGMIIQKYDPSRIGFAYCFFLVFFFYMIDLWVLSRTVEESSLQVAAKTSPWEKLAMIPSLFREDPNFARYCVVRALAGFCMMGMPFYFGFALQRLNLQSQAGMIAGVFTFTQVAGRAVGNLFWGNVSQKKGYKIPLEQACLITGVCSIITVFLPTYTSFVVLLAIAGAASAGFHLSSLNILMEFGKAHRRPTYIGISNVFSGLIGFIPPFTGGIIAQQVSYEAVFWLAGVVCIITFFLMNRFVIDPRLIEAYKD